jgi:hypothetical protein
MNDIDRIVAGLFWPMGADGVYGRTALFERIVDGLSLLISSWREPETEVLRFPPVMSRNQLERSGYLKSFPNLLGCVSTLHGTEAEIRAVIDRFEIGGEWTTALLPADLVLSPAACYPVYPLAASRGPVPPRGCGSMWRANAFAANRRSSWRACNRFACASTLASALPMRLSTFATAGSRAAGSWPRNWA